MKILRARAEALLQKKPEEIQTYPPEEIKSLVHELQVHQVELEMQNQELLITQKNLETYQKGYSDLYEKFLNLYNYAPAGYCTLNKRGTIQVINFTAAEQFGMNKNDIIEKRIFNYIDEQDKDTFFLHLRNAFATKKRQVCEIKLLKQDGPPFYARMESIIVRANLKVNFKVENQDSEECRTTITDITESRQESERRELIVQILNMLNKSKDETGSIHEILLVLKKFTGFEAVGIRLKEQDDFPYYITEGFPARFVEAERFLCTRSPEGEIVRDSTGKPYLECMCGNVLCKRTDPDLPFFTEYGSFWTNSTTELLASTTEAERQTRTRNRCHGEGYESVALIPIRIDGETTGLIQFNDRRKGMFTHELIRFFEDIGISIGFALVRMQAREQLKTVCKEKKLLLRELYHRTKNNMQVICALLRMQAANIMDYRLEDAFKEIENRIQSMAMVHEKLHESQDLSRIHLGKYIKDLTALLFNSYNISKDRIMFKMDMDDIDIMIDTAIPCGLILNELISNALKHAFPGKRQGEIKIRVFRTEKGEIQLQVSDNGVGWPEGFDFKSGKTLGLRNVLIIVKHQLHGKIRFDTDHGISCQVNFREDLHVAGG